MFKGALVFARNEDLAGDKKQQETLIERRYTQIGQRKVEIDWLKKNCFKDVTGAQGHDRKRH